MKPLIIAFFSIIFLLSSSPLLADEPIYTGFFSDKAVSGYDVVAYFTQNKAVKGREDFSVDYKGAKWLFSSQKNLDLFIKNPSQYEPQYGGYCAYAVAKEGLASSDPKAWAIYDGKLYLNYDQDIQKEWEQDKQRFVKDADNNYPKLVDMP